MFRLGCFARAKHFGKVNNSILGNSIVVLKGHDWAVSHPVRGLENLDPGRLPVGFAAGPHVDPRLGPHCDADPLAETPQFLRVVAAVGTA